MIQGVAGPYWYAGAAVVQILCFGIIAVYIKVTISCKPHVKFDVHTHHVCTYRVYVVHSLACRLFTL